MKKSLIALTLLVSVCCLSSCNSNKEDTASTSDSSSVTSSNVQSSSSESSSSINSSSNASSSTSDSSAIDDLYDYDDFDDLFSFEDYDDYDYYDEDYDDYSEWTNEDWQSATDEERKACLEFFNDWAGQDTDESNLGKIFASNSDKTLLDIIFMQITNQGDSEQADPGHGAAAGQNIE